MFIKYLGHSWPNDIEMLRLLNILLVGHAWPNDLENVMFIKYSISRPCMA